jgi:hypothetical protein
MDFELANVTPRLGVCEKYFQPVKVAESAGTVPLAVKQFPFRRHLEGKPKKCA